MSALCLMESGSAQAGPDVAQLIDCRIKEMGSTFQSCNCRQYRLQYFLVWALLKLTIDSRMHQLDGILKIRLPISQHNRASARERGQLRQVISCPPSSCLNKGQRMLNLLRLIADYSGIPERDSGIVRANSQRARRVNDCCCGYTSDCQIVRSPVSGISMCNPDCNQDGSNRSYCLYPSRPVGSFQVPYSAEPDHSDKDANSKKAGRYSPHGQLLDECFHHGILA